MVLARITLHEDTPDDMFGRALRGREAMKDCASEEYHFEIGVEMTRSENCAGHWLLGVRKAFTVVSSRQNFLWSLLSWAAHALANTFKAMYNPCVERNDSYFGLTKSRYTLTKTRS